MPAELRKPLGRHVSHSQKFPPGFDLFLLRGSPSVVKALTLCGGFNNTYVVRKRLLETLQFILQVSESVDAMKPGGVGNISSIRVRLLHAYLRSMICVRERYDKERYGVPVNDLDSLATISSFSSIIIWLGLPRQGIWLRKQEIDDYLALWRLVAYYLGVPDEPFASQQTARALMESLLVSEVDPIKIGRVLARNILHGLENKAPAHASMGFMGAMVRRLNGKQLSDSLQIPQPTPYYRVLIYGYCFFVMVLAYGTRLFPKLDQRFIVVCLFSRGVIIACALTWGSIVVDTITP